MRKIWSTNEVQYLKENYGKIPIHDLALHFNTTYVKVVDKAHKMGLNSKEMSGELWSQEEDDLLKFHFEWAPKNRLMKLFSNRTWPSIYQRGLKTLGLNRQTQDRYDINYRFFESWTPESAYIFGFIAADGYLKVDNGYRNDTSLQFEIAEYDADILYKIKDALEYEGPVTHSSRGTVRLSIFNRKICKDLADKGIPIQDKTENMFWPETLPQELESHFVRGLFDGDGSIYQKQNSICVQFLGNESVLNSLKNSLPILSKRRVRKRNYGNIWDLQYSYRMAEAIIGWMYQDATIYLQRKYDKITKISEPS